ncbi:OmpA family protein [Leptolyngbya sp. AN02str]|uniref:OmpA family protein n=1 Tax=Leptolyngbya sp. AN02str TaxID=3423363 RepID=UPI003D323BE0
MTQTSSQQPTEPKPNRPRNKAKAKRPRSPLVGLFVILFRLLLLGVGGSLAWVIGMAIAQMYPSSSTDPPLAEQVLRWIDTTGQSIENLAPGASAPSPDGSPTPSSSASPNPTPAASAPAATELSADEREQAETELAALRTELQNLNERARELATQVDSPEIGTSIEAQLQQIEQRLDPNAVAASAENPDPTSVTVADASQRNSLLITLPADALFTEDERSLKPTAEPILASIANDLQSYPGALIRISGYTNSQSNDALNRSRSYEQAKLVEQQLKETLGDRYRWITVGYGDTRPLAEGGNTDNQQRNRRIEIAIEPRN